MKSYGLTDKGCVRKDNQDCFIIEKCPACSCVIAALCDGMGGANAGKLASQLSNKAFVSNLFTRLNSRMLRLPHYRELLMDACREANAEAYQYSRFDDAYFGMGTTIVGGIVKNGGQCCLINVGDSRAYQISPRSNTVRQITKDHSYVEELVAAGAITKEEAKTHPQKNLITRALGSEPEVEADYFELTLGIGEVLLLCSDGLSNIVSDEEMLALSKESSEPNLLCNALMNLALERGARDNVTVVALKR